MTRAFREAAIVGIGWTEYSKNSGRTELRLGLEAARRALRVEGAVALARPPLVVELRPEPSVAAGPARHGLGDALGAETVSPTEALAHPERQVVLVLRDAHRHEWERDAAEQVLAVAPDAIVVETGIPLWRPTRAAGYIATNGAGRVNFEAAAEVLAPADADRC
jgi:beta-N-acetylhexosaminidase